MRSKKSSRPVTQRQLRVGEMIKQALGIIFVRGEAKLPNLDTNNITVTEVRMSPDLKTAKAFVLPLGGENANEVIDNLKEYSFIVRKVLSKRQKDLMKLHSEHHTKEHLDTMRDMMKKGFCFEQAHEIAQKVIGK